MLGGLVTPESGEVRLDDARVRVGDLAMRRRITVACDDLLELDAGRVIAAPPARHRG